MWYTFKARHVFLANFHIHSFAQRCAPSIGQKQFPQLLFFSSHRTTNGALNRKIPPHILISDAPEAPNAQKYIPHAHTLWFYFNHNDMLIKIFVVFCYFASVRSPLHGGPQSWVSSYYHFHSLATLQTAIVPARQHQTYRSLRMWRARAWPRQISANIHHTVEKYQNYNK